MVHLASCSFSGRDVDEIVIFRAESSDIARKFVKKDLKNVISSISHTHVAE